MTTPTLSPFAAPRGGAQSLRAAGRDWETTPTLSPFAAPRGGAQSLRAAGRDWDERPDDHNDH